MLPGTRNKTNQCNGKFKLSIDDTEVKEVSIFKFLGTLSTKILPGRTMLMILPTIFLAVLVFYVKSNNFFQKVLF